MTSEPEPTMLYHLLSPTTGTLYIRNFQDKGDKRLSTTSARIQTIHPIHRIEVTLLPLSQDQNSSSSKLTLHPLISFTRNAFYTNRSFVCSKKSPFTYVAQIDWSFISSYSEINELVDSVSSRQGLVYHIAVTNIAPGNGTGFRSSEIYITSIGTTCLKLPIHAFMDESLVTYICTSLPCSLTEVCVTAAIPVDSTTLSWACRNLSKLLECRAKDIRRLTIPLGLPQLSSIIPPLPRLYDFTLTGATPVSSSHEIITTLSDKLPYITILTLPSTSFSLVRNTLARLSRLQELHLSPSADAVNPFTHLHAYSPADFTHLRCLSYSGSVPSFIPLLSTLFPSPSLSISSPPTPRPSTTSSYTSSSPPEALPPQTRTKRLINLTLQIPSLTSKSDIPDLLTQLCAYFPKGVDIVKVHIKDWGVGEPKGGKWWTKACISSDVGKKKLPGRVMSDFTHPCGHELGCKVKKGKVKHGKLKEKVTFRKSEMDFVQWIGKWWGRWRKR